MPLLTGLRVIRSNIHGYGVVATRAFATGELLCDGEGVLYGDDEEFDDTYALVFDGDEMVPPASDSVYFDLVCQTRWINHSCEPNCIIETRWDTEANRPVPQWFATRPISPGEELTYDYAFDPEVAEPCYCGAPNCRGMIIDSESLATSHAQAHGTDETVS